MGKNYDFGGWATRNDLVCSDGRTIRRDAFKDCDGKTVPLVWNHQHNDPTNVLGHALLKNRKDGVYAYCSLNESESGQAARTIVEHGDVVALSIYANALQQQGGNVMHGDIKEVSLVVAGANPGAFIDFVDMSHSESGEGEARIQFVLDQPSLTLAHADETPEEEEPAPKASPKKTPPAKEKEPEEEDDGSETIQDVVNTMTKKQQDVMYAIVGAVMAENSKSGSSEDEDADDDSDDKFNDSKGGNKTMKHNVFDKDEEQMDCVLSHAAQSDILELAKLKTVGSFQTALKIYSEEHEDSLKHGYEDIEALFPDYKDVRTGAPELITRDQGWVTAVMSKVHKSPFSRIRTKMVDARGDEVRGSGFQKTKQKKNMGNMKLIKRTTDPQTVYVKDSLNRDDIVDIADFDVVQYQYGAMRLLLNEEVATAVLVGDGREDGSDQKISEEHIRSIWNDDDIYTIHYDVDVEKARTELQGSGTGTNFGENYIYEEAIVTAALYAREDYRGTGTPDLFTTPHLLNVMLLAKDRNGRRIYNSKADVAAALNVNEIYTVEQFDKLVRTDKQQKKHNLLGIFVNLADYTVGATKGGEITRFNQFDIDFNAEKYLLETRISGALTRILSAVVLEEPQNP